MTLAKGRRCFVDGDREWTLREGKRELHLLRLAFCFCAFERDVDAPHLR